jgi:hypothetical protein
MNIHEAMAPRRAISKEEIETYSRDGVVCLRGVLSRGSIKSTGCDRDGDGVARSELWRVQSHRDCRCHCERRPGDGASPIGQAV